MGLVFKCHVWNTLHAVCVESHPISLCHSCWHCKCHVMTAAYLTCELTDCSFVSCWHLKWHFHISSKYIWKHECVFAWLPTAGYVHECLVLCVRTESNKKNTVCLVAYTGQYQPFLKILHVDMTDMIQSDSQLLKLLTLNSVGHFELNLNPLPHKYA